MKIRKKILTLCLLAVVMLLPFGSSEAKKQDNEHWQILATSQTGTFTYDENSFQSIPKNLEPKDIVIMEVKAAAYIEDKNFLGLLDQSLQKKLKANERLKRVLLHIDLNLVDHTYKITEASIFTDKNKLVENKKLTPKFQPIPVNTFVAALFDKAQAKVKGVQEPKKIEDNASNTINICIGEKHENKRL